jgi:hypothetical protein
LAIVCIAIPISFLTFQPGNLGIQEIVYERIVLLHFAR